MSDAGPNAGIWVLNPQQAAKQENNYSQIKGYYIHNLGRINIWATKWLSIMTSVKDARSALRSVLWTP